MVQAKHLKVRVLNDGKEKVFLTLPIYSLKILTSVMPEAVLQQIGRRNIDLDAIVARVRASNYQPQTLFEQELEAEGVQKTYKVWIE